MFLFAASPFLKALGWALVNSLWQFAVCWLVYRTCIAGIKKLTASARHSIALLLLTGGTVSFVSSLSWKYYTNAATGSGGLLNIENNTYYTSWHTAGTTLDAWLPYASVAYLFCVVFLFIKFCLFVRRASHLQHNGITKMNAIWRTYVKTISEQLGIRKDVKALLSVHIDTPQVIGFLKPVILLPAACLTSLTTEQLEAVLLHELVHIKRNDYLVNLFVASADILFFFNPFVKQLTASIRKEREYSCDDMVMQFQYHPHNYASALLTLEKSRMMPITYGIAAGGKNQQQLLTRIERIMGLPHKQTGVYHIGASLLALLLLGFIATINPAKVAVDKFGTDALLLAGNTIPGFSYSEEAPLIINTKPAAKAVNNPVPAKAAVAAQLHTAASTKHNAYGAALINPVAYTASGASEDNDDDENILTAAQKETIDFALPAKEPAVVPATVVKDAFVAEPYVPASSFSYQLMQDTAMPKIKGSTYTEHVQKDAVLRAQKALEQINWQKIEKQLKYSRRDMARLKTELTRQIQKLNWQKITNEVKLQSTQEQLEKLQEAANQDQQLKHYQRTEAYNEAMLRQLAEQEQLIKESQQRALESRKATELQERKLQQELKKRRIIYI